MFLCSESVNLRVGISSEMSALSFFNSILQVLLPVDLQNFQQVLQASLIGKNSLNGDTPEQERLRDKKVQ